MKFPNWLKILWWFLLVGVFAYLLYQRYDFIISGATTATDIVIFLILIALLVIPLFQEVNIFGVSFKKEIDNLRTDFRDQIFNLRSDIQNTINMRTDISPRIYLTPPTDSELPSIEERIRPVLEQVLREQGIERPIPVPEELDVPDDTVFLFKVRYAIDKELERITNRWWAPPGERRYQSSLEKAIALSNRGIIVSAAINSIREIYAICSQAIHGEDVSKASVKFVQEMSSPLLAYLKSIEEQPPVWWQQQPPQWIPKQWEPRQKPKKEGKNLETL